MPGPVRGPRNPACSQHMTIDAERRSPPCVLVIFGASGDLTARKLLPALERLAALRRAAPGGRADRRRPYAHDRRRVRGLLPPRRCPATDNPRWADLAANARYVHGGYDDPATYARLAEVLAECDQRRGTAGNRVFYFATPPRLFGPIAVSLGKAGLSVPAGDAFVRAVIEKPFGWDEDERPRPVRRPVDGVRRGADLPHRPLPGEGDGAEPAGAAVRQLDLRADLEPHLGGQRADHRRRDPRRRRARRVLRDHGGDARHRPEPRPAGAVAVPHGTAHLLPPGGDPRREGQAAARDPAAGRRGGDRRPTPSAGSTPAAAPAGT